MSVVHLSVTSEQAETIVASLLDLPFKQVNQLIHYIVKEIELSNEPKKMPPNTVTVAPDPAYKHGWTKFGTPKKKPGRPTKKVTS